MVDKEDQNQPQDPMVEDKTTNEETENGSPEQEASQPDTDNMNEAPEQEQAASEETDSVEQEINDQAALAEAKDKYLRLFAEFENYRRRTSRERLELTKTASEDIVSALLPVLDDFERSLNIFKDNEAVAPMYEGIQLVYQKMAKILEQKGLKRMEISQGDDFDSEYHEAVVQTPAASEDLKGKIVDVIEQGYFLGDKVLRYAKVVIGS